jgi:hypothetical protein
MWEKEGRLMGLKDTNEERDAPNFLKTLTQALAGLTKRNVV